jgi:Putative polyhydroxyalkanoic acid system protein (PHA_gran_rgn)
MSKRCAALDQQSMFMDCAPTPSFGKKPAMKHEIAHDLEANLAKEVAKHAFDAYRQRFADYNPTLHWIGEQDARIEFNVKGMKLHGSIGIRPRAIELDLDVPFVFRLFKGKAIDVIEREVRNWIGKAKRGELTVSPGA